MSRVLVIHGCVARVEPARFAFRNLIETAVLDRWLQARPPCVPLADALAGHGTALTIDDATRAGADAALLARSRGHAVTLFVNPGQVVTGQPYAFVLLNVLLDALTQDAYPFEGQSFATSNDKERQRLRRAIKTALAKVSGETERVALVLGLADAWSIARLECPAHFATLGIDDLRRLRDAGVDLQNHGWSHVAHGPLSAEASLEEMRTGRDWLARELALDARYFAVPFGDALPKAGAGGACDVWLLSMSDLPYGPAAREGVRLWNREEPEMTAPTERPPQVAGTLARMSAMLTRLGLRSGKRRSD